jgi:hypothetical protein
LGRKTSSWAPHSLLHVLPLVPDTTLQDVITPPSPVGVPPRRQAEL